MAKQSSKRAGKQREKHRDTAARPQPERPEKPPQGKRKLDIVEEAGKESFPASDPPPWTP